MDLQTINFVEQEQQQDTSRVRYLFGYQMMEYLLGEF